MDISATTAPDSTQINAEDFIGTERTVTITGVRAGTAEQPVNIDLAEYPGRAYRPGKSMRRVLVAAWGADASQYVGRRLTLYNDPTIAFGPTQTGGIRIKAMSHIEKPLTVALTVKRGQRKPFTVQPLPDTTPAPSITPHLAAINAADSIDGLKQAWQDAASAGLDKHPQILAATNQRKAELSEGAEQ